MRAIKSKRLQEIIDTNDNSVIKEQMADYKTCFIKEGVSSLLNKLSTVQTFANDLFLQNCPQDEQAKNRKFNTKNIQAIQFCSCAVILNQGRINQQQHVGQCKCKPLMTCGRVIIQSKDYNNQRWFLSAFNALNQIADFKSSGKFVYNKSTKAHNDLKYNYYYSQQFEDNFVQDELFLSVRKISSKYIGVVDNSFKQGNKLIEVRCFDYNSQIFSSYLKDRKTACQENDTNDFRVGVSLVNSQVADLENVFEQPNAVKDVILKIPKTRLKQIFLYKEKEQTMVFILDELKVSDLHITDYVEKDRWSWWESRTNLKYVGGLNANYYPYESYIDQEKDEYILNDGITPDGLGQDRPFYGKEFKIQAEDQDTFKKIMQQYKDELSKLDKVKNLSQLQPFLDRKQKTTVWVTCPYYALNSFNIKAKTGQEGKRLETTSMYLSDIVLETCDQTRVRDQVKELRQQFVQGMDISPDQFDAECKDSQDMQKLKENESGMVYMKAIHNKLQWVNPYFQQDKYIDILENESSFSYIQLQEILQLGIGDMMPYGFLVSIDGYGNPAFLTFIGLATDIKVNELHVQRKEGGFIGKSLNLLLWNKRVQNNANKGIEQKDNNQDEVIQMNTWQDVIQQVSNVKQELKKQIDNKIVCRCIKNKYRSVMGKSYDQFSLIAWKDGLAKVFGATIPCILSHNMQKLYNDKTNDSAYDQVSEYTRDSESYKDLIKDVSQSNGVFKLKDNTQEVLVMPDRVDACHLLEKSYFKDKTSLVCAYWLSIPGLKCILPIISGDKGDIIKPQLKKLNNQISQNNQKIKQPKMNMVSIMFGTLTPIRRFMDLVEGLYLSYLEFDSSKKQLAMDQLPNYRLCEEVRSFMKSAISTHDRDKQKQKLSEIFKVRNSANIFFELVKNEFFSIVDGNMKLKEDPNKLIEYSTVNVYI